MITAKALRFMKLNMLLQPLLLLLGIVTSVIAVRMLGFNVYAHVVLLNGFIATIGFLLSLGTLATITKMWIDIDDCSAKQAIIVISVFVQMTLVLSLASLICMFPKLLNEILGDFSHFLSSFDLVLIFISTILSLIGTPILTAELENKILLGTGFFSTISNALWIILVSFLSIDLQYIISVIVIINFLTSLMIFLGASRFFGSFNLKRCFAEIHKALCVRYMKFFMTISFVRLLVYTASLPFLSLVFNHFSMYAELVSLSIIYKVIAMISTVYNIPINGVGGVLFIEAFKKNDFSFANKVYQLIVKYLTFFYALTVVTLLYSLHGILQFAYNVTVDSTILSIFLYSMLFTGIFIPSNWIITAKEHFKIIYVSSIISIAFFQLILWLYVKEHGLWAVAWAALSNSILYGGIGAVFVFRQHREILFPKSFFTTVLVAMVVSSIVGYSISSIVLATFMAVVVFIGIVLFFTHLSLDEKALVFKVFHPKLHGLLRVILK